jgi:hypothetical protein
MACASQRRPQSSQARACAQQTQRDRRRPATALVASALRCKNKTPNSIALEIAPRALATLGPPRLPAEGRMIDVYDDEYRTHVSDASAKLETAEGTPHRDDRRAAAVVAERSIGAAKEVVRIPCPRPFLPSSLAHTTVRPLQPPLLLPCPRSNPHTPRVRPAIAPLRSVLAQLEQ